MSNNLVQFLNQYSHPHTIESTGKTINIRPITTGQMKSILAYEDETNNEVIESILDGLIADCVSGEFDVLDITIQDRFDLLFHIRRITKGDVYKFNTECPKCKTTIMNFVNLTELEKVPYKEVSDTKVVLTESITANMSFVTRGIQKKAFEYVNTQEFKTTSQQMAEVASCIYALTMVSFDTPAGNITDATLEDKLALLDNLPTDTYKKVGEWFEEHDYGVKFTYSESCKFCDYKSEPIGIPLSGFFF